jgi:hypothetical protein
MNAPSSRPVAKGRSLWLRTKDIPFALSILLGMLAWGVTHIVGRALASPTLEIVGSAEEGKRLDFVDCESGREMMATPNFETRFRLTNLSRTKRVSKLEIMFRPPNGSSVRIEGVRIRRISPAFAGEAEEQCGATYALFEGLELNPFAEVELSIAQSGPTQPLYYVRRSADAVLLKGRDLETLLLRHEYKVLIGLLLVGLVLGLAYIFKFPEPLEGKEEEEEVGNASKSG